MLLLQYLNITKGINMLTLDEIIRRLKSHNIRAVARVTGLHYNTIYDIVNGRTESPRLSAVQKLSDYLQGK